MSLLRYATEDHEVVDRELPYVKNTSSVALRQLLPLEKPLVRAASPQDKAGAQRMNCHPEQETGLGSKQNKPKDLCALAHNLCEHRREYSILATHESDNRIWLSPKILRMLVALSQYTSHAQNDKYGKDIDRQIEC